MELEISTICSNCSGIDKCNKMCILHCGKALVDFIQRIDVTETKIGEYDSTTRGGVQDLVVSGHQIYDLENPGWILTGIDTTLDASDKFQRLYDKNAFQLASLYCRHMNMSTEETQEITNKIKGINRNKLLVLPFKPHTSCNVDVMTDTGLLKKQEAKISLLKWKTNKETHKLECTIQFELTNKSKDIPKVQLNIKDYIDKFRLSQMDIQAKGKNHDKDLIKINDYGMFKPIYVYDDSSAMAIDGTYLYYIINNDTHITGYWENEKLKVTTNIRTKAFSKIMDNVDYIRNHKRYIAPYLLLDANKIKA